MSAPHVSVIYSNGNLLADVSVIDGIAGIVGTVQTPELIGITNIVNNLTEAITAGYTLADEPVMYRHLKEFYAEVAGNQKLYVMGIADTMTMAQALDDTDETGAKKLVGIANGEIRLLGICRTPNVGYDGGASFYDGDVEFAVIAAEAFCQARLTELVPLRVLIEGRVIDDTSVDIFEPRTAEVGFAGVVLGGSLADGSASVGTALGRAVKYGAHIKIGKVANGPLSIPTVYIGTKLLKDVTNLVSLHDGGAISFMQHPNKAGLYFGIDHMASTDDYRLLVYGRLVDKAAIITAAVYMDELEGEVVVDAQGRMSETDLEHLKGVLTQQVNLNMADQISNIIVIIDPTQDITNTSKLVVKEQIQPLGYKSYIEINLGLNAPVAS
jgi:hypothetical protein